MFDELGLDGRLNHGLTGEFDGLGLRVGFGRTGREPLELPPPIAAEGGKQRGPQGFDGRALVAGCARPDPKELKLIGKDAIGRGPNVVSDADFKQPVAEELME